MTLRATTGMVAVLLLASCGDAEAPGSADVTHQMQLGDIPELNVDIGDFFVEIDDLNQDDAGNRDANLCSNTPNGTGGSVLAQPSGLGTACPNPLPFEAGSSLAADNPNYPGPDPTDPETLGADESFYVDWAGLDPDVHITPFDDSDASGDDDILSPGSCYKADGNSPPKANFTTTGFAANDSYLYILQERQKHQGNEEYHFFFTKNAPELILGAADPNDAYSCDTWVWDLQDDDVEVIISYPNTSGLPETTVRVNLWRGGDQDDTNGEGLVQGEHWVSFNSLFPDENDPVFVAINIARHKEGTGANAVIVDDTEHDFDGTALASGLKTEVAIDLDAVFGAGCGLNQFVAGISTASAGGLDDDRTNDDLKDFLSPKNLKTGAITTDVTLIGSCEPEESQNFERFDYTVTAALDDGTPVTLPDEDLVVEISYDCNNGEVTDTFDDPDHDGIGCVGPSPDCDIQFPSAPTFPADCEVTATVTGTGGAFDPSCTDDATANTTIFEEMTAELGAGAADVCPVSAADILDSFPFNLQITGGSGTYSVVWGTTGDAENNTCAATTEIEDEDTDFSANCFFDLDTTLSCTVGSVTATVSDDVCLSEVGPLAVAASRTIERTVQTGCALDSDCGAGETCENGFCEIAPP